MSNSLLKKVTAAVALTAIVSSTIGSVSSTYASTAELEAAAKLADAGVITTASDYRLGDTITRREMLKVMVNLSGLTVENKCEGKFTDLPATDWGCKYAEAALAKGFIAANAKFRPNDNVSKAEAVKMVMKAKGLEKDATAGLSWEAAYVKAAVAAKLVDTAFTDYSTASKRGFTIVTAANAIDSSDDLGLDDLLDGTDDVDSSTGTTDDTTTDTTVKAGDLSVDLSAETPAGTDLPKNADGITVMAFDVTAGDSDVTISSFNFERTGFGDSGVEEVAVYSDNGRVTKADDFNDDDLATVNASPTFVVKAGSTETLYARVNTANSAAGEFQVVLKSISSTAANVEISDVVSNTFDVKNVTATVVDITDEGVNDSIKLGETGAELAEFKLSNEGNADTSSDVSVTVSSITLKETLQDVTLENLALVVDGKEVATADSMNGKYVTFNLESPIVIKDDNNETFTLTADVIDGANENVKFQLESLMDITATASKYNAVSYTIEGAAAASLTFGNVKVDAGELTVYAIDATSDETRSDKDDVELGQLKIVNVAGENLELKDLKLHLALTNTTGTGFDTLAEVLDNVKLVYNNSSEDLDASNATASSDYSASSLDWVIPQGTSYITVKADFLKDIPSNTTVTMSFDADPSDNESYTNFVVEESSDDEQVTDITPSTLSWDSVKVVTSDVTVSNVPLADVSVVKWASTVKALQFELKASDASAATLDEAKVTVYAAATSTGTTKATKDEVSEVALYRGSVSDANLLDKVSGSKLSSGVATFDGFETSIAASATETFIVTVAITDTTAVSGKKIRVELNKADLSLEDDDNDPINLTGTISDKIITVSNGGTLTIIEDASNTDNKYTKTILAGNSKAVFSADIEASNEKVDVETVKFTLDWNVKEAVSTASLYLNGVLVATAPNSDISDASSSVVTFDDLTTFEVPTSSVEVQLVLNTATIGFEKVWEAVSTVKVTRVDLVDATGMDSNEDASVVGTATADGSSYLTVSNSKTFAIVPSVVTPSVYASLNSSTAPQIQVTADAGSNSETTSNTTPKTYIDSIKFTANVTDANSSLVFKLQNVDDSSQTVTWSLVGGVLTFDLTSNASLERSVASAWTERFKIVITWATTDEDTLDLTLLKNGITYTVSGETVNTNLTDEIDFGSRTY